jgi:hypothetical protein
LIKEKRKYETENNQEDEDGYSHNSETVFVDETAKGKHHINSNKFTAIPDLALRNLS